jgi:hypothetical protein
LKISPVGLLSGINGIHYADVFQMSENLLLLTNDISPVLLNKIGAEKGIFNGAKVKIQRDLAGIH